MKIRKASQDDQRAILDLERYIFRDMGIELDENKLVHAYQLAAQQDDRTRYHFSRALVASQRENILGVLFAYSNEDEASVDLTFQKILADQYGYRKPVFPDRESFEHELYIDSIVVSENARGQGIGHGLLSAAKEMALSNGEEVLGLNVDLKNPRAHKLYEGFGFKQAGHVKLLEHNYQHMQLQLSKC
ncbi:GNAT family N-acetyltransferase [Oenococcus sicerae]|uniref:GNAT family N-acetyltransferase n=1 Tax=Oenococcus sicerae TaxID=2203724 RepID=A0AAJ1RCD6_9LACO|nr:GNAT family N-acetyltransferase [Oenococcus sicerae]MDN6899426.1 GNAT family N-acetyltransferase [Oenococcus sicerae]QAS70126.1 GNAT family N-acetyltransferase [Oenococcus sicerae]VDK13696.1 hypothetical protein OAL24_00492 [Oenococcus sicerae]